MASGHSLCSAERTAEGGSAPVHRDPPSAGSLTPQAAEGGTGESLGHTWGGMLCKKDPWACPLDLLFPEEPSSTLMPSPSSLAIPVYAIQDSPTAVICCVRGR